MAPKSQKYATGSLAMAFKAPFGPASDEEQALSPRSSAASSAPVPASDGRNSPGGRRFLLSLPAGLTILTIHEGFPHTASAIRAEASGCVRRRHHRQIGPHFGAVPGQDCGADSGDRGRGREQALWVSCRGRREDSEPEPVRAADPTDQAIPPTALPRGIEGSARRLEERLRRVPGPVPRGVGSRRAATLRHRRSLDRCPRDGHRRRRPGRSMSSTRVPSNVVRSRSSRSQSRWRQELAVSRPDAATCSVLAWVCAARSLHRPSGAPPEDPRDHAPSSAPGEPRLDRRVLHSQAPSRAISSARTAPRASHPSIGGPVHRGSRPSRLVSRCVTDN